MPILFKRSNPKGELVVSVEAGKVVAMFTPAPPSEIERKIAAGRSPPESAQKPARDIGNRIVPLDRPTETPAGRFTHAIGASTTFSLTEDEYEAVAAVTEPKPLATAAMLVHVRNMADADAIRGVMLPPDRWNGIGGMPFWQHRRAVRAELHDAYNTIYSERIKAIARVAAEVAAATPAEENP